MPFGVESSPDVLSSAVTTRAPHWVTNAFRRRVLTGRLVLPTSPTLGPRRHQCLSASSPHRTPKRSNRRMTRNQIRSPMPFGVESSPDDAVIRVEHAANWCHQCLSASSPHRTGKRPGNKMKETVESPMPFGVESSPDTGPAARRRPATGAGSPMPFGVESSPDVGTAAVYVVGSHSSPMPFGVESSPDPWGRALRPGALGASPMPFGVESSPDTPTDILHAPWFGEVSPMPFGVESSPDDRA